ncbi:MAG: glycosyltransferase family 2 protein [Liquorilactobacillus sp.]|uniref:glycosyltransferase n=1 Tax=Liquorilactobacillus nagelii TaxID=82688 RepID=UPI0039EBCDB8
MKLKLSVCIITRNEVLKLERCLTSIASIADEIVVVDTGSEDQTIEICQKFTTKVFNYKWTDNFAAARNYAIAKATNDLIWMIDSDEVLKKVDFEILNDFIMNCKCSIGQVMRENYTKFNLGKESQIKTEYISRIFSRKYYEYMGRVHEQLIRKNSFESKGTYVKLPLVIEHDGYEKSKVLEAKARRNLRLLKLDLIDHPQDPYIFYQIGKSLNVLKKDKLATIYLKEALTYEKDVRKNYVYDCVEALGYTFNRLRQMQLGIALLKKYSLYKVLADYCFLLGLLQMNTGLFDQAVASFLQATKCQSFRTVGTNGFLAYYNIGVIYEVLGKKQYARAFYQKCGAYKLAKKGLERISD